MSRSGLEPRVDYPRFKTSSLVIQKRHCGLWRALRLSDTRWRHMCSPRLCQS